MRIKKQFLHLHNIFNLVIQDPLMFLDIPQDGCFYRAHIIAEYLLENSYSPVIFQIGDRPVRDKTPTDKKYAFRLVQEINNELTSNTATFFRHVAAGIKYKNKNIVFDPVLFDAPVSSEKWAKATKQCLIDTNTKEIIQTWPVLKKDISEEKYQREKYMTDNCLDIFDPYYFFMFKKIYYKSTGENIPICSDMIPKNINEKQLSLLVEANVKAL